MRCSPSSAYPKSGDYLVSGHRLKKTLAKTLTNCLTRYVRSSVDKSISTRALNVRFINILHHHLVGARRMQGLPLENSDFSCAIVRINAFFSTGTNGFDMEHYQKLHDEYRACVGGSQHLVVQGHYDRNVAIVEQFMMAKLPGRLLIERQPCRFQHIKSMSSSLSEAFLLLNRGCALIMLNGMCAGKKVIHPKMESSCFLLTWEQSRQDGCQDRAQLFDLNIELHWQRAEYDASETYPAFLNRFIHDVADYGGFHVKSAGMTGEEVRLFIIHDQPEYTSLAGLAPKPIPGV